MSKPPMSREDAAAARRASVVTRATHPGQRRCSASPDGGLGRMVSRAAMKLRAKADTSLLEFDGYASAYERGYDMWDFFGLYTEIVSAGAGEVSLKTPGLDVPLVLQHQQLARIARTTNGSLILTEEDAGLRSVAPELDPEDRDVAYIAPKLRSGLIDEMSFAFRIVEGIWSPDYTEYRINAYDIHRGDVSIVGYGANPHTSGGLRAQPDYRMLLRDASDDSARAVLAELLQRFPGRRARKPEEPLITRVI